MKPNADFTSPCNMQWVDCMDGGAVLSFKGTMNKGSLPGIKKWTALVGLLRRPFPRFLLQWCYNQKDQFRLSFTHCA
jgi:hypothetical protein